MINEYSIEGTTLKQRIEAMSLLSIAKLIMCEVGKLRFTCTLVLVQNRGTSKPSKEYITEMLH